MNKTYTIAIIGGGPSGLFMYKRLVDAGLSGCSVDIFEKSDRLGQGMPYGPAGALDEHITNVSGNEIPALVTSLQEWINTLDESTLTRFGIDKERFSDYKVIPRLLFGNYLRAQFTLLNAKATAAGILTHIYFRHEVTNIEDYKAENKVAVHVHNKSFSYDRVIICTGHTWPKGHEATIPGYFDSPYPPAKLQLTVNHPVAIKGASLTAIDALRTLARQHGQFTRDNNGRLIYKLREQHNNFRLVMHSRSGLLPAVRFHLEDSHLGKDTTMTPEELKVHRSQNNGFLSLDYIFERNFKEPLRERHPEFWEKIKGMTVEQFVDLIMSTREQIAPFDLLRAEYAEAEKSIRRHQSVHWKELLAILSFTMNYPAKYFSAEDMQRLQKVLMPLISLVIAFVPQSSADELLALFDAGVLDLVNVGEENNIEVRSEGGVHYHHIDENGNQQVNAYPMFIDCTGQPHLNMEDFPYEGLHAGQVISPARIRFQSAESGRQAFENGNPLVQPDEAGNYYLRVPGIAINDHFQVVDRFNAYNERIYLLAVPFIGGYNPDYSGLDFCEAASAAVIKSLMAGLL